MAGTRGNERNEAVSADPATYRPDWFDLPADQIPPEAKEFYRLCFRAMVRRREQLAKQSAQAQPSGSGGSVGATDTH